MRWVLGTIVVGLLFLLMKDLMTWSLREQSRNVATSSTDTAGHGDIASVNPADSDSDDERKEISSHRDFTEEDLQHLIQAWKGNDEEELIVEADPGVQNSSNERAALAGRSLESIQLELNSLPGGRDYAATRSFLLNAAAQVSGDDEEKLDQVHALALRELFEKRESVPEQNEAGGLESFSNFVPVVAHEVALKTAPDVADAMQLTVAGWEAYPDPAVRSAFIQHFIRYFPEEQERLQNAIAEKNSAQEGL